jgi:TPR repeat protein
LVLALAFAATTVSAGQLEDAVVAYQKQDYPTAQMLFRPLAEGGDAFAQLILGFMRLKGDAGGDQKTVDWAIKAAEAGYAHAQLFLGFRMARGMGIQQDEKQAVYWFHKAADQGEAYAQLMLGFMYNEGRGVSRDDQQSVFWFQRAADQGRAGAQFNLGVMFAEGKGVPKDDQRATYWYRKAAEQAYYKNPYPDLKQRDFLIFYQAVREVPKGVNQQAISWYWKAAEKERQAKAEAEAKAEVEAKAEAERIVRERDGNEDDLACKAKRLKPSTPKYLECRDALAQKRERLAAAGAEKEAARSRAINGQDPLSQAKTTCAELGFKTATEKFGDCVLQMLKGGSSTGQMNATSVAPPAQPVGDGSQDDGTCQKYGFSVGGQQYSSCRLQLGVARQQAAQAQQQYQEQLRQYEEQKAAYAAAEQERKDRMMLDLGQRLLSGQSIGDAAREAQGLPPIAPRAAPTTQTITMPNGRTVDCRTVGSRTDCF